MLGATSVTFRSLSAGRIISLAKQAGFDGIEWGGDIHVPPDALQNAKLVYQMTSDAGLKVMSYGSYYRLCAGENFDPVLETAAALNAPLLRIWAGGIGSAEASDEYRKKAASELKTICAKAGNKGIKIGMEYHRGTLTDTYRSTLSLLESCEGLYTYWQPNPDLTISQHLEEINALKGRICSVHVFSWERGNIRFPLQHCKDAWKSYLNLIGQNNYVMEFVKDDSEEQFLEDASVLKRWVTGLN